VKVALLERVRRGEVQVQEEGVEEVWRSMV